MAYNESEWDDVPVEEEVKEEEWEDVEVVAKPTPTPTPAPTLEPTPTPEPIPTPEPVVESIEVMESRLADPRTPEADRAGLRKRISNQRAAKVTGPTPGQSFISGVEQGASFGLSDEIVGAYNAFKNSLGNMSLDDFAEDYIENRDIYREELKKIEAANPSSYLGGQIGGGVLSSIPGGVVAGESLAAQTGIGLAEGALAGFGGAEGSAEEQLTEAGKGALLGGVAPGLARTTGKVIGKTIDIGKKFVSGSSEIVGKLFGNLDDTTRAALLKNKELIKDSDKLAKLKDTVPKIESELEEAAVKIDDLKTSKQEVSNTIKNLDGKLEKQETGKQFIEKGVKEAKDYVNALGKVAKEQEGVVRKTLEGTPNIEADEIGAIISEFSDLTKVSGTVQKGGKEVKETITKFGVDPKITKELDRLKKDLILRASRGRGISQVELNNYIKGLDDLLDFNADAFGREGKDLILRARGTMSDLLKSNNTLYAEEVGKLSNTLTAIDEAKSALGIKGGLRKGFETTDTTRSTIKNLYGETSGGKLAKVSGLPGGDPVVGAAKAREDYLMSLVQRKQALEQEKNIIEGRIASEGRSNKQLRKTLKDTKATINEVDKAIKKTDIRSGFGGGIGGSAVGYGAFSGSPALAGVGAAYTGGPRVARKYYTSGAAEVAESVGEGLDKVSGGFSKLGEKVGGYTPVAAETSKERAEKAVNDYKKGQK